LALRRWLLLARGALRGRGVRTSFSSFGFGVWFNVWIEMIKSFGMKAVEEVFRFILYRNCK